MKESYRKGVANHPDPESCVGHRKVSGEALTGAQAGRTLSCEIYLRPGCRRCSVKRKAIPWGTTRECCVDAAQSENPGMLENSTRENRETLKAPAIVSRRAGW